MFDSFHPEQEEKDWGSTVGAIGGYWPKERGVVGMYSVARICKYPAWNSQAESHYLRLIDKDKKAAAEQFRQTFPSIMDISLYQLVDGIEQKGTRAIAGKILWDKRQAVRLAKRLALYGAIKTKREMYGATIGSFQDEWPKWMDRERHWRYRARQSFVFGGTKRHAVTFLEFESLCAAHEYKCTRCGEVKPLTVDHIEAIKTGGDNLPYNIQPLCAVCNSSKGQKRQDYRTYGFRVPELLAA